MKLTIHRGTHEIGGSCLEITNQESTIIIDIGMPIVKSDGDRFDFKEYEHLNTRELIKEKILPDIAGIYEWNKDSKKVDGLFISHAHLDHYGLYSYLQKDIPCFIGKGTKWLIDITNLFLGGTCIIGQPVFLKSGRQFEFGRFGVTPYLIDHSAFDSYALNSTVFLYTRF
jgi:ribonuclease J